MSNEKVTFKEKAVNKLKSYYSSFLSLQVFFAVIFILVMLGPRLFGYTTYTVVTDSMYPNLKRGYVTFVDTSVKPEEINKDDIIAFKLTEQSSAIHRVVEVNNETQAFTTKGDANRTRDVAPVYYEQVVGRASFNLPVFGYFQLFFMSVAGKIISFAVLLFDIFIYIVTVQKDIFKDDSQTPSVSFTTAGA